jgi:hypothetical protein
MQWNLNIGGGCAQHGRDDRYVGSRNLHMFTQLDFNYRNHVFNPIGFHRDHIQARQCDGCFYNGAPT